MALEELIAAYHKIKESHPSSCFEHKKEIYHYVAIKLNGSLSISGIYKQVMEIASLFALLICCPVYPKNISIYISHKDDHLEILELCPTIIADKRTMDLASTVKHHSLLPITHSYIDLGRVLEDWHKKSYQEYSVLVSAIQHETGFRTMHSLHGEIVIYLSQLESISKKEGKNREQDKYDYSIEKYASPEMREGMGKLLQKVNTNKSLGAIISNLRTDIAHVNISPKRVLTKMSLQDLADLVRYLQLTVISYVLLELGVDDVRVKAYQDKFIPKHNRG
jgi:thiaminase